MTERNIGPMPFVGRRVALRVAAAPLGLAGAGVMLTTLWVAAFLVPVSGPGWLLSSEYDLTAALAAAGWGLPAIWESRRGGQLEGAVHAEAARLADGLAAALILGALYALTLPPRVWAVTLGA